MEVSICQIDFTKIHVLQNSSFLRQQKNTQKGPKRSNDPKTLFFLARGDPYRAPIGPHGAPIEPHGPYRAPWGPYRAIGPSSYEGPYIGSDMRPYLGPYLAALFFFAGPLRLCSVTAHLV